MKKLFRKNENGFTLTEIAVAIFLLVILITIAVMGARAAIETSRIKKTEADLVLIKGAVDLMRIDTKEWPGHQQINTVCSDIPGGCPANNEVCPDGCTYNIASGYAGLLQDDATTPYSGWDGPYLRATPVDPWGNQYFFDTDYDVDPTSGVDNKAVIGSYGPNGVGNNVYDADDVILIIGF